MFSQGDRAFSKWMLGSGRFKCNLCNFRNTERIACINHLEGIHNIPWAQAQSSKRKFIELRRSKVAIQCYLCDKFVRHDFKFLAFHFATHHANLDVKVEYFDLFRNSARLMEQIRPDLQHLDRGDPNALLGFRNGGEECLRKCSLCSYVAWDPVDMGEHWNDAHDTIMGGNVDEGIADSFSVCLKGYRCKEADCGRSMNTAKEAEYHDCLDDEDDDIFFMSDEENEAVMQDSEGEQAYKNVPIRVGSINGEKRGKGKRTPKSAGRNSKRSAEREWYNGCEFYCPEDEECKYAAFPHKDSLTKHWKSRHGGSAKNLPVDRRNVVKKYKCQKCTCLIPWHRVSIYSHLKTHGMSVAQYEEEFNPEQDDDNPEQDDDISFSSDEEDEAVMQDSEGEQVYENVPIHGRSINGNVKYGMEEDSDSTDDDDDDDEDDEDGSEGGLIESCGVDDEDMFGYEDSEDNPHMRHIDPDADEGEWSEGIEEEEGEELNDDDDDEEGDVGEEACEVINDSGEEDDIKVIGQHSVDDVEPGEIEEVGHMEHHDIKQTPWKRLNEGKPELELAMENHAEAFDEEIEKEEEIIESSDPEDPQPQHAADPNSSTVDFHGFNTPTSLPATPTTPTAPHSYAQNLDNSGESVTKMWHSACSYECLTCGYEGDYLTIDRHVRECQGIQGEMSPGLHYSGKIEYHVCFLCDDNVECDPHIINQHMSGKHRRSLSWYESKYKETLVSVRIKTSIPNGGQMAEKKKAETNTDFPDYETPSKKAKMVTSTPVNAASLKLKSKLPTTPTATAEINTTKRGRKRAKNQNESAKVDNNVKITYTMVDTRTPVTNSAPELTSKLATSSLTTELNSIEQGRKRAKNQYESAKVDNIAENINTMMVTITPNTDANPELKSKLSKSTVPSEQNSIERGQKREKNKNKAAKIESDFESTHTKEVTSTPIATAGQLISSKLTAPTVTAEPNKVKDGQKRTQNKNVPVNVECNVKSTAQVVTNTVTRLFRALDSKLTVPTTDPNTVERGRKRTKKQNESTKAESNVKNTSTPPARRCRRSTRSTTPVTMPSPTIVETAVSEEKQEDAPPRRNPGRRSRSNVPVADASSHDEDQGDQEKESKVDKTNENQVGKKNENQVDKKNEGNADKKSENIVGKKNEDNVEKECKAGQKEVKEKGSMTSSTNTKSGPKMSIDHTSVRNDDEGEDDDDNKPLKSRRSSEGKRSKSRKSIERRSSQEENEEQTGGQKEAKDKSSTMGNMPSQERNEDEEKTGIQQEDADKTSKIANASSSEKNEEGSGKMKEDMEKSSGRSSARKRSRSKKARASSYMMEDNDDYDDEERNDGLEEKDDDEEEWNLGQGNQGKRKSVRRSVEATKPQGAWYDGCEFHCPEGDCGKVFEHKDLLNKHWRHTHRQTVASLNEKDFQKVIRQYECKKCRSTLVWNRKAICDHVKTHEMSFGEYEAEFHSDQAVAEVGKGENGVNDKENEEQQVYTSRKSKRASSGRRSKSKMPKFEKSKGEDNNELHPDQAKGEVDKKESDGNDDAKKEQENDKGKKCRSTSSGNRSKSSLPKPDMSRHDDKGEINADQTMEAVDRKEIDGKEDGKDEQQTDTGKNSNNALLDMGSMSRMPESDTSRQEENRELHQAIKEVEKKENDVRKDEKKEEQNDTSKRSRSVSTGRRSRSRKHKSDSGQEENDGEEEEEEWNEKPGKGKRTPKSAGKISKKSEGKTTPSFRKTPSDAWYKGCEFYCPEDAECKYAFFPHKDSFYKHWRSWHGGSVKNLPVDPRNVIKQYQCKMCPTNVQHNRDMICKHLRAAHKIGVAEYEKEFHPK